jgi:hypothetical protein
MIRAKLVRAKEAGSATMERKGAYGTANDRRSHQHTPMIGVPLNTVTAVQASGLSTGRIWM